ncbi:hypothetical protein [Bacillus sp. B-jedd]|uniref:hypothetical protein n=1 Tax=Bacillus sp. B-jedd TaxID=1476857 RepID=UPI00051566DA|nr:hypothetical protein [Bacillus sp. B-jedd]CEG27649.1 hypothetical protein BN1002_02520 [Bacillus sp. B-jedd]
MPYIIENAAILREGRLEISSILTDGKEITAIRCDLGNYSLMKLEIAPFIMTPAHTILDSTLPCKTKEELADTVANELLKKGCTTILTYVDVESEKFLQRRLKEIEEAFILSPADYAIGAKVDLKKLTPSFLRECKKMKLPAVFVNVKSLEGLDTVPWGWLREAIFPYNCPLIPVFDDLDPSLKKQALAKWEKTMLSWKLPSLNDELAEGTPLPKSALNMIGIYPWRSSLLHKAELSYNLYIRTTGKPAQENSGFCQKIEPAVTVHKGRVIRWGEYTDFIRGSGEYIKVKTHAFYSL